MNDRDPDAFYLIHMLECISAIETYCASGDFESDDRTLDAVLRRLQILTEIVEADIRRIKGVASRGPMERACELP